MVKLKKKRFRQEKITPCECILRIAWLNGECCPNFISNTDSLDLIATGKEFYKLKENSEKALDPYFFRLW